MWLEILIVACCKGALLCPGAMERFFALGASSNSGRAEQPLTVAASSNSNRAELPSAEQPATSTTSSSTQVSIKSIRGVERWLTEDHVVSCTSADAQRIREAVVVLSRPKPKQEDVQPLQSKWQVAHRNPDTTKRKLPEVIEEFRDKIIKAAQKLQQQLADSAEQPAVAASSTDRADVQNVTAADEEPVLAKRKDRHRKRTIETETDEPQSLAKPKAAKKQKPTSKRQRNRNR